MLRLYYTIMIIPCESRDCYKEKVFTQAAQSPLMIPRQTFRLAVQLFDYSEPPPLVLSQNFRLFISFTPRRLGKLLFPPTTTRHQQWQTEGNKTSTFSQLFTVYTKARLHLLQPGLVTDSLRAKSN